MIEIPTYHPGESDVAYLRRKEAAFGLWQGEAMQRIYDLEAELFLAQEDCAKYRRALSNIHEALGIVAKHAMLEGHEISADDFARDFAPYINIMAHHGMAPEAKPKRRKAVCP